MITEATTTAVRTTRVKSTLAIEAKVTVTCGEQTWVMGGRRAQRAQYAILVKFSDEDFVRCFGLRADQASAQSVVNGLLATSVRHRSGRGMPTVEFPQIPAEWAKIVPVTDAEEVPSA